MNCCAISVFLCYFYEFAMPFLSVVCHFRSNHEISAADMLCLAICFEFLPLSRLCLRNRFSFIPESQNRIEEYSLDLLNTQNSDHLYLLLSLPIISNVCSHSIRFSEDAQYPRSVKCVEVKALHRNQWQSNYRNSKRIFSRNFHLL